MGIMYFVDNSIAAYFDAVSYFATFNFSDAVGTRFGSQGVDGSSKTLKIFEAYLVLQLLQVAVSGR